MTSFDGFTQPLGSISVGSGRQVLPAPSIPTDANPHLRSTFERTFVWNATVAEPISTVSSGGDPIPVPGEVAATYTLEVTPDLGWANYEAMFQAPVLGRTDVGNDMLRQYKGLTAGAELSVNTAAGGSLLTELTYTIDIAEISELIGEGYPDFLWRVRGVRNDGNEGTPSAIQRFRGRVEVNTSDIASDSDWTIDPISLPVQSTFVTISGTKTPAISYIEVDGNSGLSTNLSAVRWTADVMVPPSGKKVFLRAVDTQGNTSVYKTIDLTIETAELEEIQVDNVFDEFGIALDLERLPSESNEDYRTRLLDVNVRKGTAQYSGLRSSITRGLNLSQIDDAIVLTPGTNPASNARFSDVEFSLGQRYAKVNSPLLRAKHEYKKVDGWDWSVSLDRNIADVNLKVESPIGIEIDDNKFDVDIDSNKIVFTDETYAEKDIWVSYEYYERFDTVGQTIAALQVWLSTVTVSGAALVNSTANTALDTSKPCDELERLPRRVVSRSRTQTVSGSDVDGIPLRWCEAIIRVLQDAEVKERFKNSDNSYFGTSIEGWATRVKNLAANQWGYAVADRSVWMSANEVERIETYLDTTFDAPLGFWTSSNPQKAHRYTTEEAYALNYISPGDGSDMVRVGLDRSKLKSGIGDGVDLMVRISEDLEPFSFIQNQAELDASTPNTPTSTQVVEGNLSSPAAPSSPAGTPIAPPNFQSSIAGTTLTLTWDEVTNVTIAYYEVRKGHIWSGSQLVGTTATTTLSTSDWTPTDGLSGTDESFFVVAVSTAGTYGYISEVIPTTGSAWHDTNTYSVYTSHEHEVTTSLNWDGGTLTNLQNDTEDTLLLTLTDTAQQGVFESPVLDTATVGKKTIGAVFNGWNANDIVWNNANFDWSSDGASITWFGPIDPSQWASTFTLEFAYSADNVTYSNWQPLVTSVVNSNRYFKVRVTASAPATAYTPYLSKLSWIVQDTP